VSCPSPRCCSILNRPSPRALPRCPSIVLRDRNPPVVSPLAPGIGLGQGKNHPKAAGSPYYFKDKVIVDWAAGSGMHTKSEYFWRRALPSIFDSKPCYAREKLEAHWMTFGPKPKRPCASCLT
jgi:hypothetical protein